jgi:hypothetical protein
MQRYNANSLNPGNWIDSDRWSMIENKFDWSRDNTGDNYVRDGRFITTENFNTNSFYDQYGRRCKITCDRPRRVNLIGMRLEDAKRIHPNLRVVVNNNQRLPTTMDYRYDRVNVVVHDGIITRIDGYY